MIASRFVKAGSFIERNPRLATIGTGVGGLTAGWIGANAERDVDDIMHPHRKISLTSLIIVLIIIGAIIYYLKK